MNNRVLVGMSGGVDSSVAAKLLIDKGMDTAGVTLKLFSDEDIVAACDATRTCCALLDVQDARDVARKLGIEHFVFNFREAFAHDVIDRFIEDYRSGRTPNPCIDCNRFIKFEKLLERAMLLNYDRIATGHYSRIAQDTETGRWRLLRGRDPSKDQSYVLYGMTQQQLSRTLFPLGDMTKEEARAIAEAAGLVNARKPDSQDICFVPGGDYTAFIEKRAPGTARPGDFVTPDGRILGRHRGITAYTIGQRRGIGASFGTEPLYVIHKDASRNTVTLGNNDELLSSELVAGDINLIGISDIAAPLQVYAKIRYNTQAVPAVAERLGDSRIRVRFDTPVRAVAPGQAVVLYRGDEVLGGGTIEN